MSRAGVSQLLQDQYGVAAHAGAKGECPFCHHQTLSVHRDDSLAKCFHSACGRFITAAGSGGSETSSLSSVLVEIYHDFHQELLRLKSVDYPDNAYRYLG